MSGPGAIGGGSDLDLDEILAGIDDDLPEGHRSGMVALVGRPNVGKSTLLNRMVGEKIAIVTEVPGTTRSAIRGVLTREDAQVVFLDLPGLAKPRTLLTRRLNDLVRDGLGAVDVICFLVDIAAGVGPGDAFLAGEIAEVDTPVVVAANKEDEVTDPERMIPELDEVAALGDYEEIIPVSAITGFNVDQLLAELVERLPEGRRLFSPSQVTDQPERILAAEIIREKLIQRMEEELPHSIAVEVEELGPAPHRDDLVEIYATIFVERESQKGIVIGRGGRTIKAAATEARRELEAFLDCKVYLDTHVTVSPDWQTDPRELRRRGF